MVLTLYRIFCFCFQMCNRLPEINKNGDAGIFPVYYSLNGATYIFFYLEWPEGIVSIPVGQPDPTRPISLTLTQTPLPQLTAWSQFIAAALGHSTVWADFVCVSGSVLSWPTRPNGQPDPTRPISLTLTHPPPPQLTAWSQFIAGAWS